MIARKELEELYKREEDVDVKERLLLILRVEGDGVIPARAARELHRSRPWVSYWLGRFSEQGVDGLRDRVRSGRPPKLPVEVALKIRGTLSQSRQGWTTKQIREIITIEGGGVTYHRKYVYRLLHRWGLKQKVPRKRHVNTASREEKQAFKKEWRRF